MTTPLRLTAALALLAGGALVVDTVTITVINGAFDPLDSILFFVGFVAMWLTAVALAAALSAGRRGLARLGVGVGVFVGTVLVLGVVSFVCDRIGRRVFSSANVGLHSEWSFFSIGVCLLLLAGWAWRRGGVVQIKKHHAGDRIGAS